MSWLVSNCHSDNHREDYVEELRKYSKGISCKVYLFTCYFVTNKNFFYHIYVTKIMIYLAWVAYSMVVLSASYRHWNSLHLSHRFLLFFSLFLSSFSFFSRVHATLQLALSDCPSVRPSNFTFSALLGVLALLLLPKCSTDLTYGPCSPARDWGSRVSGLV